MKIRWSMKKTDLYKALFCYTRHIFYYANSKCFNVFNKFINKLKDN